MRGGETSGNSARISLRLELSQSFAPLSIERSSAAALEHVAHVQGRMYHRHVTGEQSQNTGSVLVLGVGNVTKGDDGVGPYVAQAMNKLVPSPAAPAFRRITAIDCGTVPENYTSVIRRMRPQHLVIVDAAEMNLRSGDYRIISASLVGSLGLSTHSMPLSLFMTYVSELVDDIVLIGVQPRSMALGADLSPEVLASGRALVEIVTRGRFYEIKPLG